MMPGVVAGGAAGNPSVIRLTSDGTGYEQGSFGSISPTGASAIPGGPHVPNANGEILRLVYEVSDGVGILWLTLRGSYSSPPFASLSIDGGAPITFSKLGENFRSFHPVFQNPLTAGQHLLEFS